MDDAVLASGRAVTAPGPWVWSSVQAPIRLGRAPRLGEHNRPVLRDLLGYSDEHIDDLHARGVLRSSAC